jgi:hypothetical protein
MSSSRLRSLVLSHLAIHAECYFRNPTMLLIVMGNENHAGMGNENHAGHGLSTAKYSLLISILKFGIIVRKSEIWSNLWPFQWPIIYFFKTGS